MKKIVYLLLISSCLSACGVKYKSVPYFTNLPDSAKIEEKINNYTILKIQRNDVLAINVSSLNNDASAIFNFGNTSSNTNSTSTTQSSINGFIVDQNGEIQLPYLGSLAVAGLSTAEARVLIQRKLSEGDYLKQPIVSLRLVNFKISVLGDVASPGVFPLQSERVTITEALSMAGDLTITAKRNNVLLIREINGKREQVRLNLQQKELFNSPYYYLQNNDVLYVQPGEAKYASVDSSYRNVSIILSALSVIALIISRL